METKELLYLDSKNRLVENIKNNISELGAVNRQILKGSKSNDVLIQSAKVFSSLEFSIENTSQNINKIATSSKNILKRMKSIGK